MSSTTHHPGNSASLPLRVLLLEDSPRDAKLTASVLEGAGARVQVEVTDSADFFRDRLEKTDYDVIVSDFNLRNWTALDALEILKSSGKDIPLIVVTGTLGDESAVDCIKQGAADFVLKDRPARLPVAIQQVLEERRLREEGKRAEGELRASEIRYRRLFEAARDGILILDIDSAEIRDVNPYLTELLEFSKLELMGKKLWEIGPFRDVLSSKEGFKELQSNGFIRYDDLPLKTRSGKSIAVEFVSNVYLAGDQKVIQCNIRDITERKRGEESLRESEERFRATFENAGIGIALVDMQGRPFKANPILRQMLGYSEVELSRMIFTEFTHPDDRELDWGLYGELTEGKRDRYEIEKRFLRKNGDAVWGMLTVSLIKGPSGGPVCAVVMIQDITARKLLEDQFRQAQKMEAVGRLAAGVAHDFNNLLTIIIGYSEVILDRFAADDPMRAHTAEIKNAAERAAGLTRQLLAFSRQQVLAPQILDLNALIVNLTKLLNRLIGEDVDLVFNQGHCPATIKADPGHIEQILMNLAVNSRDAMPRGGKLTIEISPVQVDEAFSSTHISVPAGPYVMLAVSDTGCGMDKDVQAHMFEPFFTTKEQGKGTGLGLATVYGIVKQSGGHIWVYSEPGAGTTFKIYLPAVTGSAQTAQESAVPAGGSETVLLVEDDAGLRELARMVLADRGGYKVLESTAGKEALVFAEQYKGLIHLMLTDVVMPGMSGRELSEELATPRPEMKILYMSGYTDDTVVRHGVLEEGMGFLQKPFTSDSLLRKVREVLDAQPHA